MTGARCPLRKKMMGRCPDGGCGTDERLCRFKTSRVPATQPTFKKKQISTTVSAPPFNNIDFFAQARKALTERSPHDASEDGSGSGSGINTLPSGLASLLKQTDSTSRKRHKKSSHFTTDKKKSSSLVNKSKAGNIWHETEEFFRDLTLSDVDALFELYSSLGSLGISKCFLIPSIGNENDNNNVTLNCENGTGHKPEDVINNVNPNFGNGNEHGNAGVSKDEVEQEEKLPVETDNVGAQNGDRAECAESDEVNCVPQEEEKDYSKLNSANSLEWLLGCKSRINLTSERPSKNRKLLGTDAGLEKVLVGSPCEGNTSLCDFCCKGELSDKLNQLIVCSSCKVAVHVNCYGVKGDIGDSWSCAWCKQKTDVSDPVEWPCVLCPKQGGALKPAAVRKDSSIVEFAHLFCSLWMPDVYVEDLTKMGKVLGLESIPENKWKLECKVCKAKKHGACVRCSYGACRTAFHPICAREGGHRMEVWGKYGSDNVELRAFCIKHSELPDAKNNMQSGNTAVTSRSSAGNCISPTRLTDRQQKLKSDRNGDEIDIHVETPDNMSDKSGDSEVREIGSSDSRSLDVLITDSADGDQVSNMGMTGRSNGEDVNLSNLPTLIPVLKKLIDLGKVNVKDLALELGISPDSLLSTLDEDSLVPDLQNKLIQWLRSHAYFGALHKNLKAKLKSAILSGGEVDANDLSDSISLSESDITDQVAVKLVPPRRRTKSNVRILRNNKSVCLSDELLTDSGMSVDEVKVDQFVQEGAENSTGVVQKTSNDHGETLAGDLPQSKGSSDDPSGTCSENIGLENTAALWQGNLDTSLVLPDLEKLKEHSKSYVHPYINKTLANIRSRLLLGDNIYGSEGLRVGETCCLDASTHSSVCCDTYKMDESNSKQLVKAKKLGVHELSPADEVEGEIIYFQQRLLGNAIARKRFTDNLVCKVAKSLPHDIDTTRAQRWDAVLANQYLNDVREAKKQGRKERRHKEAQAVLAAATAAAAASSRISSFRKDAYDESSPLELMPRPKETPSKVAILRNSLEKYSDFVQSVSEFSKEHPRSCDICRRSETILNPILVCSSCKVAVHLDCYRSVKESTGPWYCELCEELLSSKLSAAASLNFWEKPYFVAECGLCGGTTGAFRKSSDKHWVHAFCAEWVFEPTFRRGQVNPVEGMDTVGKGIDTCCICRRKHGVCIRCSYGHCQTTFHPSCARSAGLYMTIKSLNGKLQHKAYCERHGFQERAKAETQKHGAEELRSMKQIRVELERLRLLCERIIKREKIKRDLVLCSHNILACKRDHVARSALAHSPFFNPDVSSESATTSLKGNTDGYRSCSDAMQRSDDVTVDSIVSVRQRVKFTMDPDQKTDDSSTSQNLFNRKPVERMSFAGKHIPHRASIASRNPSVDGEWSSISRKPFESLEKELVMTSDQASMKNQQLPKGYIYIPVDCLPKEKRIDQDASSDEPLERKR